jgi:hypothetical protein
MDKSEVEEILIKVTLGQEEAFSMKIYKNGILCRQGCGAVPKVGISAISFTESSDIFDTLIEKVPQIILDNSVIHEDSKINIPLEYILAFYGVSKNGETGERAEWTKSTGLRFLLDNKTNVLHPLVGFIDNFAIEAADITNSWYFDVIINAIYEYKSNILPGQTIIGLPKSEELKKAGFQNYINQMNASARKWNVFSFADNKTYETKDGIKLKSAFSKNGKKYNFRFVPVNTTAENININLIQILGIYQVIGAVKCTYSLFNSFFQGREISGINILLFFLILVLILFGALSGVFCLISEKKGLNFSFYNQILQLVSFVLFGLTYKYIAGFDFSFCLDLSGSAAAGLQFGFSKAQIIFETQEKSAIFCINLATLGLIYLIDKLNQKTKTL